MHLCDFMSSLVAWHTHRWCQTQDYDHLLHRTKQGDRTTWHWHLTVTTFIDINAVANKTDWNEYAIKQYFIRIPKFRSLTIGHRYRIVYWDYHLERIYSFEIQIGQFCKNLWKMLRGLWHYIILCSRTTDCNMRKFRHFVEVVWCHAGILEYLSSEEQSMTIEPFNWYVGYKMACVGW